MFQVSSHKKMGFRKAVRTQETHRHQNPNTPESAAVKTAMHYEHAELEILRAAVDCNAEADGIETRL